MIRTRKAFLQSENQRLILALAERDNSIASLTAENKALKAENVALVKSSVIASKKSKE
jgi:hypothetical protein